MRRKNMKKTAALFLLSVGVNCMTAQDIVPVHEFDIDIQKVGSPIQSTMYGIFFEDINFGEDGGTAPSSLRIHGEVGSLSAM